MTSKPKLLDLFCGQGGAGWGYAIAGFDVLGIDSNLKHRARHRGEIRIADALAFAAAHGREFDAIHASPPCQRYSHLTPAEHRHRHADLIGPTRDVLRALGKPYVIENVLGAASHLIEPTMLCGSMFGLRCRRHRFFEVRGAELPPPPECDHTLPPLLVTTASKGSRAARARRGEKAKGVSNGPLAYGIDWMNSDGLKEAIPPAYTHWIGLHLRAAMLTATKHPAAALAETA